MTIATDLSGDVRDTGTEFLLAIADDEFVWGHRLSEWVALGPTMEEDNALAAISQDEFGHARLFYEYVAEHAESDLDDLALNRPAAERRNTVLVEAEHADFADTIAINFLYDEAEVHLLQSLADGTVEELAARAGQALAEEPFHREHADLWLDRLVATEEGRRRLSRAFRAAVPRAADYFAFRAEAVEPLVEAGLLARSPTELRSKWLSTVRERLAELPLELGDAIDAAGGEPERNGRASEHTPDLASMIDDLHPDDHVGDHPVNRYEK